MEKYTTEWFAANNLTHVERRRMEYPSIGDQLDALWKGGEALEDMQRKIREIKLKYPKLDNKSFL